MKNALIYARVSTEEQAEEGQSIETQIRICKKWAKDNDYKIDAVYTDEGKSATNLNRPALQDLLARCRDDFSIDAILVQDTDRLARNTLDHLTIKAVLKKKNIKIISISQPMIDDSPEGNLIDTILASVNTFQSQLTGRKTSKVLEEKAKMGWYPGGRPQLGYMNAENPNPTSTLDKRIVVLNPDVAPYIKQMFEMYSTSSHSVRYMANWLNKKGIRSVTGGLMHTSSVDNYLKDPFYVGRFLWNGKTYQGKHEKLIDDELFNKVQEILRERNQHASRKRIHNFLLSGFAYCADCGGRFWAERHVKKNGVIYDQYFCSKCKSGTYVDVDKLEEAVELLFQKIELSKEYTKEIMESALAMVKDLRQNTDSENKRLTVKKNKLNGALKEVEDQRFVYKSISDEKYLSLSARYEADIRIIDEELTKLTVDKSEKIKDLDKLLRLAENIGLAYKEALPAQKRNYLTMFFEKFEVSKGKIVKYHLSSDLKELIENGSVRVRTTGLPRVDSNHGPFAYKCPKVFSRLGLSHLRCDTGVGR